MHNATLGDALRSSMETTCIILLKFAQFYHIWESILFIIYGIDKKSLRITVLSMNHFVALSCGCSRACKWQTVHLHRPKWLLNECRMILQFVEWQCCDLLNNDHSSDAILNSLQITWTWDWKTIGWRRLTSGNLLNGVELISLNCFQKCPTCWMAYFNIQCCLTFVEQDRSGNILEQPMLNHGTTCSFTTALFFCMKTSNKGFVTLKISSGFCKKKFKDFSI